MHEKKIEAVSVSNLDERLKNEILSNLMIFLILKGIETYGGRSYGYQIKKYLERLLDRSISEGTLYPLLSKLANQEKYGYLDTYLEKVSNRTRRYYTITEKGKKVLENWPNIWNEIKTFVDSIIERVLFEKA